MNKRRFRPSPAMVVACLALFVALGGTALAASYVVSSNSQIGPNTVSGHHPPSGKHANLIRESIANADLSAGLKTSLKLHCPSGLRRAADICFDPSPRAAAGWLQAVKTCASAQGRLPDAGELALVFDHLGAPQGDQWITAPLNSGPQGEAAVLGDDNSRNLLLAFSSLPVPEPYRCVTSVTN